MASKKRATTTTTDIKARAVDLDLIDKARNAKDAVSVIERQALAELYESFRRGEKNALTEDERSWVALIIKRAPGTAAKAVTKGVIVKFRLPLDPPNRAVRRWREPWL